MCYWEHPAPVYFFKRKHTVNVPATSTRHMCQTPKIDRLHHRANDSKVHRKPRALIDVTYVWSVARRVPNRREMTKVLEMAVQPTQFHLSYELVHKWLGMATPSFHKAMLIGYLG